MRAILAGHKTMTRRVIVPQPHADAALVKLNTMDHPAKWLRGKVSWFVPAANDLWPCSPEDAITPKYKVGDRLWVRETFKCAWNSPSGMMPSVCEYAFTYKADGERKVVRKTPLDTFKNYPDRWRPSIHMPRWASRIMLEIVSIRVERLRDIPFYDIRKEGVNCPLHDFPGGFCASECDGLRNAFAALWDSINEKRGFGWDVNPWVWVIEFKRIHHEGSEEPRRKSSIENRTSSIENFIGGKL